MRLLCKVATRVCLILALQALQAAVAVTNCWHACLGSLLPHRSSVSTGHLLQYLSLSRYASLMLMSQVQPVVQPPMFAEAERRCSLFCVLCTKRHGLMRRLAEVFGRAAAPVR